MGNFEKKFDDLVYQEETVNCDTQLTLNARIKCRLEQKGPDFLDTIDESCKVLKNPTNCKFLYSEVSSCYDLSGQQKDQCFKRTAGFTKIRAKNEASSNNKEPLRNYLIFLLYDLQEKIEDSYKESLITTEQASETISLIVQIKQKIFLNKTKSEIKPFIQELKAKMQELKI